NIPANLHGYCHPGCELGQPFSRRNVTCLATIDCIVHSIVSTPVAGPPRLSPCFAFGSGQARDCPEQPLLSANLALTACRKKVCPLANRTTAPAAQAGQGTISDRRVGRPAVGEPGTSPTGRQGGCGLCATDLSSRASCWQPVYPSAPPPTRFGPS